MPGTVLNAFTLLTFLMVTKIVQDNTKSLLTTVKKTKALIKVRMSPNITENQTWNLSAVLLQNP